NEIRRMYDRIVPAPARAVRTWLALHWNRWRRRHQTHARTSHYHQTTTHRDNTGCSTGVPERSDDFKPAGGMSR
ncbi:hypothetical protein ACFVRE_42905, partial [Streptomyces sp. NPDC057910]